MCTCALWPTEFVRVQVRLAGSPYGLQWHRIKRWVAPTRIRTHGAAKKPCVRYWIPKGYIPSSLQINACKARVIWASNSKRETSLKNSWFLSNTKRYQLWNITRMVWYRFKCVIGRIYAYGIGDQDDYSNSPNSESTGNVSHRFEPPYCVWQSSTGLKARSPAEYNFAEWLANVQV